MLRAEYSRQCCTAVSRRVRVCATTTRCVSLPQLPDSLHRLAKEQSRRPPDFLSGYAYIGGKWEHRGDFTQGADLIRGVCGAHGGYETAEERGVDRIGGGSWAAWGTRKKSGWGVSWTTSELSVYQRRLVDDCSPGRGGMSQNGATRGGKFHSKMDRCRAWARLRYTVLRPNLTGRTKERIAQSKRARGGLLAAVD